MCSKSNREFNNDIISLSEGLINYYDFIAVYRGEPQTYYDFALDKVVEYFRENYIDDIMSYGSDSDSSFGLTSLSDMYKNIMDKLNIKYESVSTENVSDGKYFTRIILENNEIVELDTSAWNGLETITENVEYVYVIYENSIKKDNEIKYDYE